MTDATIHAAVLHELGGVPRYELFPAPVDSDDAVVVEVAAAALKPSDRLADSGVHYAPEALPVVVGLDGVGRLKDGTRIAFLIPEQPYGGMAEQTLIARGRWLPVPDGVDDVTAAALVNPGMAAWKTIVWEGEVAADQRVLILGATSTAGQIAAQLAVHAGAHVIVAGRDLPVLDELAAFGAAAIVRLDQPQDQIVAAIAGHGAFDLIADFVWGAPAEATFRALITAGGGLAETRYIVVGMAAGETASLPAMALRRAPVHLHGSGSGKPLSIEQAGTAYGQLLEQVAAGRIAPFDVETVALSDIERVWNRTGSHRRVVLSP
jgi:NADPH:quinone reductase-like Zn-dependent oxidoreductase